MSQTCISCFNTQPPEGGWNKVRTTFLRLESFNTQPPEGGWFAPVSPFSPRSPLFQHTAARRRLGEGIPSASNSGAFQHTAARRRLGLNPNRKQAVETVSTHSRPKAAGSCNRSDSGTISCFNTQPPEGGWFFRQFITGQNIRVSTHSRPKAAGFSGNSSQAKIFGFQHTAARRRLVGIF